MDKNILTYREFLNESVKGETAVRLISEIIYKKTKEQIHSSNKFKQIRIETLEKVANYNKRKVNLSDFDYIEFNIGKNDIKELIGKIPQKIYEAISLFGLDIRVYAAKLLENTEASIAFDPDFFNLGELYMELFVDNVVTEKSLFESILHEFKHYYDYVNSEGKAIMGKVGKNKTSYFNSQHELSARFTEFINDNYDKIQSGTMNKVDIINGLKRKFLHRNRIITQDSFKWALKKVIGYINQINNKKIRKKIDIGSKITDINQHFSSSIFLDNGIITIDNVVTEELLRKLIQLSDIYRYDIAILETFKKPSELQLSKFEFMNVSHMANSFDEELIEMAYDFPSNTAWYRESKRKI
jgi:hypothetical protein